MVCSDTPGATIIIKPIIKAAIDDIIIDVAVFLKSSFIYASSFHIL